MTETEENTLAWLGNGLTVAQRDGTWATDYLDQKQYTNRPIPVNPDIGVETSVLPN